MHVFKKSATFSVAFAFFCCIFNFFKIDGANGSILTDYYHRDTGRSEVKWVNQFQYFGITRYDFTFKSLEWPEGFGIWEHRLSVYVPKDRRGDQGLMLVNGGIHSRVDPLEKSPYDHRLLPFMYSYFARRTHSIIVELKDVPNQYIQFGDDRPRKEDDILAYAWRQYIDNPLDLVWPPHLPMAKATSLAMDAVDVVSDKFGFVAPAEYVLTGISKRAWSSWLTALEDKRVVALVTAVNEVLDTQKTMRYIRDSILGWPEILKAYLDEDLPNFLDSENFCRLMDIEDPYQYIKKPKYRDRFKIPKYLIRTSGDDFFVPDCQNTIFKAMPGMNYVRVLPNQSHYLKGKDYMMALYDFYAAFIKKKTLPNISEESENGCLSVVKINDTAKKITLWQARNKHTKDFRLVKGIIYESQDLTSLCRKKKTCTFKLPEIAPGEGYLAQFVEVRFNDITLTTNVYITPNN